MRTAAFLLWTCLLGRVWGAELCGGSTMPVVGSPAAASSVAELLEVTGVFARAASQADRVVAQLQSENPRVPPALWARFEQQITSRDALITLYAPVYAQCVSEDDLRGALAFYRSPAGSRLLEAMPAIQSETRAAALSWVSDIAADLIASDEEQATPADATRTATSAPALDRRTRPRVPRVHELLEASGAVTQAQQMMNEMIDRLKAAPQGEALTPSMWEVARGRLTRKPDLIQLWTPAYVDNLNDHEVAAVLKFYQSAPGRRFVAAQSAIQKGVVEAAAQQSRDAVRRATREVLGPLPQWALDHPSATPTAATAAQKSERRDSPP
jgi:hypothetical protein